MSKYSEVLLTISGMTDNQAIKWALSRAYKHVNLKNYCGEISKYSFVLFVILVYTPRQPKNSKK